MAGWSALALGVLYAASRRLRFPARDSALGDSGERGYWVPDLLTVVRGIAAVVVLWVLPGVGAWSVGTVWAVGSLLAVVELTDFFDGRVARRLGPTVFGATWDMENDALFTLGLSLLVYTRYGVTPFVVLLGLMRYLYVLIWRFDRDPVTVSSAYKRFAKTTAAAIVVTLLVTIAPIVPSGLRVVVLMIVLGMQVVSFGWDLALQYEAVKQSGERT
jgi:phosphatidylglycerophosphate synthase